MSWQGKIIGGSLGSFFGPIGTLAGAAAGHLFVDRRQARETMRNRQKILALLAGTLYELAVVDGAFTPKEEQVIQAILREANEQLGHCLNGNALTLLMDQSRSIAHPGGLLVMTVRTDAELSRRVLFWMLRVAVCDGGLSPQEHRYLMEVPAPMGIPADLIRGMFHLFVPDPQMEGETGGRAQAFRTLELQPGASAEEVKKAYRQLSLRYHPDRHADLPPEIRVLTAEKFSQIHAAYDLLQRGEDDRYAEYAWGRDVADGHLVQMTGGTVTKCFVCGTPVRLPSPFNPFTARCPVCQALLTFERAFAEVLV
ncbi:MAG: DnaJ domain-containing protein [Kiritimatiellae bacterium]|nr:DnaJ domain-containing protein [Kiritimatiellia bacterium]